MDEVRTVGFAFVGIGAAGFLVAAVVAARTRRFLKDAARAEGTVIRLEESSGGDGGTVYHPVIRFATAEGQEVEFREGLGSNPPRNRAGDTVSVLYDPARPNRAKVPGLFRMWFLPILFAGLGVIFLGTSAILLVVAG